MRKVFTAALTPDKIAGYEPVSFALAGYLIAGYDDDGRVKFGEMWTSQDFRCLPDLPSGAMEWITQTTTESESGTTYHIPSVIRFLADVIIEPDRKAFHDVIQDPARFVGNEQLAEAMEYVTKELSGGRPTTR